MTYPETNQTSPGTRHQDEPNRKSRTGSDPRALRRQSGDIHGGTEHGDSANPLGRRGGPSPGMAPLSGNDWHDTPIPVPATVPTVGQPEHISDVGA